MTKTNAAQYQENDIALHDELKQHEEYPWQDDQIRLVCISSAPHHPAYGMMFGEYKENRNKFSSYEDREKARLSSRFSPFVARVSADMAIRNKVSHYRFLVLILELGMINFQKDYHEKYQIIKSGRNDMYNRLTTDKNRRLYDQLEKQSVDMVSYVRDSKHLTPTVPEWLANAANETATYLNMSTSDFIFLCWCIGVSKTIDRKDLPLQIKNVVDEKVKYFDQEITFYSDRIIGLLGQMD